MQTTKTLPFPNIVIVGAGGVGSYLLPTLLRTIRNHAEPTKSPTVTIYDGDKLEKRNMERQLFSDIDIGSFKADALVKKYKDYYPTLVGVSEFFTGGEEIKPDTLIIVCVDNHPGRMRCYTACNTHNARAIFCGNGYTDAEAFFYHPLWKDGPMDPIKYYPEIATVADGDPLQPEGCTGHAQIASPQLAIANFMAAAHALHLLWFWTQEEHQITGEFRGYAPIHHANNFSRMTSATINDKRKANAPA